MWKKLLACILALAAGIVLHADRLSCELSDGLLRLHILANSDSEYDQKIKLAVRDRILEQAGAEFYQTGDRKAYRGVLLRLQALIRFIFRKKAMTESCCRRGNMRG